jgi:hypothetical protein
MAHAVQSDIQKFLLERIPTHEALQIVMLLARRAEEKVTVTELARSAGLSAVAVEEALDALVAAQLVRHGEGTIRAYWYEPRDPKLDADVRRTLMFAEQDHFEVARMLAANSVSRLRRIAYRAYASAFVKAPNADQDPGSEGDSLENSVETSAAVDDAPPPDSVR